MTDLADISARFDAVQDEIAAMEAVLADVRGLDTPWANGVRTTTMTAYDAKRQERRTLRKAMTREVDTLLGAKPVKVGKS